MNPVDEATNEIAENWGCSHLEACDLQEFYDELHNPNTDARVLLEGQVFDPIDLTAEQWHEVLERLRVLFPKPEQQGGRRCDYCANYDEEPRVAVEKRCIGGYVDAAGVSHNSYDYLCGVCQTRDGDE